MSGILSFIEKDTVLNGRLFVLLVIYLYPGVWGFSFDLWIFNFTIGIYRLLWVNLMTPLLQISWWSLHVACLTTKLLNLNLSKLIWKTNTERITHTKKCYYWISIVFPCERTKCYWRTKVNHVFVNFVGKQKYWNKTESK